MDKKEYLGVIPARRGSKRIQNKNTRLICGKPLIYWTIKSAKESKMLDGIVVTTDDDIIKSICSNLKIDIIDRPKELAGDNISLHPVLAHIIEKTDADNIVLLRPTSPIRNGNLIDECINRFKSFNADSLCTGFTNKEMPAFIIEDTASQLIKGWFQNDGNIEIHTKESVLSEKGFGNKKIKYETDDIYHIEIDTEIDFIIAETLMKYLGMDKI